LVLFRDLLIRRIIAKENKKISQNEMEKQKLQLEHFHFPKFETPGTNDNSLNSCLPASLVSVACLLSYNLPIQQLAWPDGSLYAKIGTILGLV
jgi:hypothetical protein